MKKILMAGLLLLSVAAAAKKPNVIIILTDDQGYQDLSCYGHPDIKTPHIDAMASEGIRFTNFYVSSSKCSPSRGALLTGRYHKRLGFKGVFWPDSEDGLSLNDMTIAELLKKGGYQTACVGKWHLGHKKQYLPTSRGFDYFYGIPYSNDMFIAGELPLSEEINIREGHTLDELKKFQESLVNGLPRTEIPKDLRKKSPLMENEEVVEWPCDQSTTTKRYTEKTISLISQYKDHPFFIYLTPAMPHTPLAASTNFLGTSAHGLYGDVIEELDWGVGQILNHLKALNLDKSTLVIFASDNGPWLKQGDHGGHALPLRDGKGSQLEGGNRIPCIMKMNSVIPQGVTYNETLTTLDFLPTISALSGVPLPPNYVHDGFDITSILKDPTQKSPYDLFLYHTTSHKLAAVRQGEWKLQFLKSGGLKGDKKVKERLPALYNLRDDISESKNVADRYPEVVSRLQKAAFAVDKKIVPVIK